MRSDEQLHGGGDDGEPADATTRTLWALPPQRNFMVGLGVATIVALNCLLCATVARKVFSLPVLDEDEDDRRPAASEGPDDSTTGMVFHAAVYPSKDADPAELRPFGGEKSRNTGRLSSARLCSTPAVCERLEAYLVDALARDKDPCDDFYEHVCSRWRSRNKLSEAPFPVQSTGKLLYEVQKTLSQYLASHEQAYHDFPGAFVNRAAYFLPNCTSAYSRNRLGWDPWQQVLRAVGLDGWPYQQGLPAADARLYAVTAKVDGLLALFPFVQVRVKSEYERCCSVQLHSPSTVFRRHALWYAQRPPAKEEGPEQRLNYTDTVASVLTLLGYVVDSRQLSADIAQLEMRLENALDLRGPAFQGREQPPEDLPASSRHWRWKPYLEKLFASSRNRRHARGPTEKGVESVEVWAGDYVQDLAEIMENSSRTTLFNYVGFRLMVHLSPLLPDEAAFLVPLSHEPAGTATDRFLACGRLLERLFPFGTRTFLRMRMVIAGKGYANRLGAFVERAFNDTRRLLAERVGAAHWLNPVERAVAREKLAATRLDFGGAEADLKVPTAYYDSDGPLFDGARLLSSYVQMQAHTRRLYYHPIAVGRRVWDFDNRYHVSSLRPGYEFVHGRNLLFVPYSVVAFAQGRLQSLDAALEPLVTPFLLRGLLEAVDQRGAWLDHRRRVRSWWGKATHKRFGALKACFFDQYRDAMQKILGGKEVDVVRDVSALVAESLLLEPLHERYLRRLRASPDQARDRRSPVAGLTYDQLFYVLYAAGQCERPTPRRTSREGAERARVGFGEAPARARINVALRNYAPFAAAFGCQRGHDMRPRKTCPRW